MTGKCGECTLCCLLTGVKELEKPIGVLCPFCIERMGCTIYASRPQVCVKFECAWLREGWEEEFRPDKCRLMFEQIPGSNAYIAIKVPGFEEAWLEARLQEKMNSLASKGNPVVIRTSRKTVQVLTPPNVSATEVWEELKTAYRELI